MKQIKGINWKNRDILLLMERLELYLAAGLTIDKALMVARDGATIAQRKSLENITQSVISGMLFSRSLSSQMKLTETVIGLIRHGESSGDLGKAIGTAHSIMEKGQELRKKCISALIYPTSIGVFALVLTIGLMHGVMPQIIPLLSSLHVALPILTRIVMGLSEFITSYGIYFVISIFIGFMIIQILYRRSYGTKRLCHMIGMRSPIVGPIICAYSWSLFMRSCGALVDTGVSLPDAYERSASHILLYPLRDLMKERTRHLRNGASLAEVMLIPTPRLPAYAASLISAGEMSGTLGSSLIRVSSIIDRDLDHNLKKMTVLIEPVMMAGIGIVVGSIALSIMMPIYDMSRILQN